MTLERLYLDTSVPSAWFDDRQPGRRDITRQFWTDVLPRFSVFLSEVTQYELRQNPNAETRQRLLDLVADIEVLPLGGEARLLAESFMEDGLIHPTKSYDARHLAVAIVSGMDVVVSWNFDDMVNYHTKRLMPMLCAKHGYFHQLLIMSPLEFSTGGHSVRKGPQV